MKARRLPEGKGLVNDMTYLSNQTFKKMTFLPSVS